MPPFFPAPGDQGPPQWKAIACDRALGNLNLRESLADGRTVLAVAGYFGTNGWTESAAVFEIDSGRVTVLEENTGSPCLMPGDRLLMSRNGTLLAAPWDAKRRRLAAQPVAVMQGLRAEGEDCWSPRFSPDGRILAWVRMGVDSTAGLWVQPLDGSLRPRRVLAARSLSDMDQVQGWYPDGRSLIVDSFDGGRGRLRRVTLSGDSAVTRDVVSEAFNTSDGAISPDGRRLAYQSYESGQAAVVVAALRPDGGAGPPVPVSRGPGLHPRWADDGTLLWVTPAKVVMASRVSASLEVSPPVPRADLSALVPAPESFAALPGGLLLVTRRADGEGEIRRFDLVLDYGPELERALARATRGGR